MLLPKIISFDNFELRNGKTVDIKLSYQTLGLPLGLLSDRAVAQFHLKENNLFNRSFPVADARKIGILFYQSSLPFETTYLTP